VNLLDVNVLVYAHRQDAERHADYRAWLEQLLAGDQAYGVTSLVLGGFLRVVTHSRVFAQPTPLAKALEFVEQLRTQPACVSIEPGMRHWEIFVDLCRRTAARGNHVPDAYLAALALESGSQWVTTDRGFARYPGLRWAHPLDEFRRPKAR